MRVNQIGCSNIENLTYKSVDLQFDSLFILFKPFLKGVELLSKGKVFILKTTVSKKLGCFYCLFKVRIVIVNDAFIISRNDRRSVPAHISDICSYTGTVDLNIAVLFPYSHFIINTFFAAFCRNFISHNITPCFYSITVVNTHPLNIIDQVNFRVYTVIAAAKSVAGIGVPEFTSAHDRAIAVFLCVKHGHIRIMVGRAGASKDAPGSLVTGYANPVRLTTSVIGVSSGEFAILTSEAVTMTTIPAIVQPEITIINGQAVTSSLAVADYFTKRHDDVLKKIRVLECSPEFTARNFAVSEYTDATGRKLPCYQITRDGFAFLAMGFTGKRAAQFKEPYITAFNQMEKALITQVDVSCTAHNAHVVYLYMAEIHRVWMAQIYPMLVASQSPIAHSLYDYINDGVTVAAMVDNSLNGKRKEVHK
ncbi:hypothetical protein JHG98_001169 [Salmonella enterica]|nr:hypothetical protein [Salmonella enterica subsp. enterica serovar Panama]EGX9177290.1 hypothetical protein [Salmonella enterica]EGZ6494903.1 hypothetical protein [Salmonella enterica]